MFEFFFGSAYKAPAALGEQGFQHYSRYIIMNNFSTFCKISENLKLGYPQKFPQSPFLFSPELKESMMKYALIYVPERCRDGSTICQLHVHFHPVLGMELQGFYL